MFRFFNPDNFGILTKCSRSWSTRPILCDLCLLNNHRTKGLHMSSSDKAQYLAALKHLLTKKTKPKKSKRRIEVLKGTDKNIVNSTTSVTVIRGKQLSALASRLASPSSQNVIKRLYAVDTTRHYDPLVVLPVEIPNEFVEKVLESIDQKNRPKRLSKKPLFLGLNRTPSAISVRDVIKNLETKSSQDNLNFNMKNKLLRKKLTSPIDKVKLEVETLGFEDIDAVRGIEEDEEESLMVHSEKKKRKGPSLNVSLKNKTREAIAKHKMSDLEKKGKEDSLNMNFLSYCDVCVYTGMVNDAFFAIKSYRKKISITKSWHSRLTNIEVYNTVIAGLAEEGNWLKISDLITFIKEDGLKKNAQTFAGILDCMVRRKNLNPSHLKTQLDEMSKLGIDVNEVLSATKLKPESRQKIIKTIQQVDTEFTPKPLAINLDYDCQLLNYLNEQKSCLSSAVPSNMSVEDIQGFYEEQMDVEASNYVKIKTIEKRTEPIETIQIYRDKLEKAQENWRETVAEAFDRDLETIRGNSKHKTHFFFTLLPYLLSIPKEEHVDIVLQEIRKLAEGSETYSPTTRQLHRDLGTQVYLRYQIKKKIQNGSLKQMDKVYQKYSQWYHDPDSTAANTRQKWQQLLIEENAMTRLSSGEPMWKPHVLSAIGRFLYNIIIHDVKIDVNSVRTTKNQKTQILPAFYTLFRTKGHSCKEEVKPHPVLSRLFRAAAPDYLIFESSKIPMVCPPLPWTCITSGGYLITKTDLIRLPYRALAQWKALEKTPVNQLYPAFDSLNQLGAVPWTVNEEMLDVILEVFNSGGSAKLDVPEPPSSCPAAAPVTSDLSSTERAQIYRQRMAVRRQRAEMYSLWCDALYKLSLANHFRNRVFWLPHNMDFRGRVYPVAPHLNHLGSDLSRSLLVFAKGKPLGENGLDWLKIHAINLTGTHKKQSVQDRLDYANEIIDDIIDSANLPLTGKKWWMASEEPWQTLAACIEIRNALASGNPQEYLSQFPVHQDGSCNGLQHYAALGRDSAGGESVNLTPGSVPQDVYSCVAAIVERERAKDASNGVHIAQILENFIFRKVIKQTVMTTVYGVTRFGARLQIARQLKDLDDFPKQHVWQASLYLVTKTFESLQEMFTSTKEIQDWFTECARLIAQVCGENVQWVTPLGLPIVQPYSRNVSQSPEHIKFIGVQTSTITDAFERPNIMKQKNAFPPNFIHSLDSSHMMLTSILCERLGVTFVSVHDCYWTHACTVPEMNRVCRDQFVALHSYPILSDLSTYFINRYSYPEVTFSNDGSVADLAKRNLNRILKDLPTTGTLDLQAVLKSPYFFS